MKVVGIIPARLASTRFPGKPLADILGKPMIEHVYRRAKLARLIDDLYIATCDEKIAEAAGKFGAKVVMTSPLHSRCTDRVAEAVEKIDADIVLNIQGDEPLVDPESLDKALAAMKADANLKCINLVSSITDWNLFVDQNVVKTVFAGERNILYFSRQPIPNSKESNFKQAYRQIGIYIFRKDFLLQFLRWDETPLEKAEKIDMMRIIEHGHPIRAFLAKDMISVDTPEDLVYAESIIKEDLLYNKIFKSL